MLPDFLAARVFNRLADIYDATHGFERKPV